MKYDVLIVGAGIIGLSTAMQLLKSSPKMKVLILEKEETFSSHQTGRNSGVIHSGIYYKPNSLKALNCIQGRKDLIDFCNKENIDFEICGKLVVAQSGEDSYQLKKLYERGKLNGLEGIKILSKEEIKEREPFCQAESGLLVPQTGIINYNEVSEKFVEIIKLSGGDIKYENEVLNVVKKNNEIEVITNNNSYLTTMLVSCAGLNSDRLAKMTEKNIPLRITPFKGEYFLLKPKARQLVKNLIYPVPNLNFPFLGVHFTRMIDGSIECGPNAVFSFAREGYRKTSFNLKDTFESLTWPGLFFLTKKYWKEGINEFYRSLFKEAFVRELQKLVPDINADDLVQGKPGIRAQACSIKGDLIDDFYYIKSENIIHLCNAPSPAATASLAIGKNIVSIILKKFD